MFGECLGYYRYPGRTRLCQQTGQIMETQPRTKQMNMKAQRKLFIHYNFKWEKTKAFQPIIWKIRSISIHHISMTLSLSIKYIERYWNLSSVSNQKENSEYLFSRPGVPISIPIHVLIRMMFEKRRLFFRLTARMGYQHMSLTLIVSMIMWIIIMIWIKRWRMEN